MAGLLIVPGLWPVFDSNGDPVAGATINFYQPNTTTPKPVYSDATLSTSLGTSLTTNAAGEPTTLGNVVARLWWAADAEAFDVQVIVGPFTRSWSGVVVSDSSLASLLPVSNITALRAATWPSGRPTQVQVVSNWVTGDGGGVFRWDATSTATDDSGTIIKEAATTTGRWIRQDMGRTRKISWFGAISPTVDSSAAVNAAIMSLPVTGGDVIIDSALIALASPIIIGDGTNTTRSTRVGVRLVGQGGSGVGEGNYGTPNFCTTFRWIGTKALTQTMLEIRGPIHSLSIERITFDGAGRAGRPVQIRHMFNSYMTDLRVERFWECGIDFRSNDAVLPAGVTSGSAVNTFRNVNTGDPWEEGTALGSKNNAIGMRMHGGPVNNVAMSRNLLIGGDLVYGGGSLSCGLELYFADNNTFIEVMPYSTFTDGEGLRLVNNTVGPLPNVFPLENTFLNCPILQGIKVRDTSGVEIAQGGVGNNLFLPYPTSDGEPIPTNLQTKTLLPNGRLTGRWCGSALTFNGRNDAGVGLTSANRWFPISGLAGGSTTLGAQTMSQAVGGNVSALRVRLDGTPGAGNTRTFTLLKNGVATSATVFFNSGETGDKSFVATPGISFSGGDNLEIQSSVTGTPTNSSASWSVTIYQEETL